MRYDVFGMHWFWNANKVAIQAEEYIRYSLHMWYNEIERKKTSMFVYIDVNGSMLFLALIMSYQASRWDPCGS